MLHTASELRIRGLERVTGIEPALSAWELYGAVRLPPADSATRAVTTWLLEHYIH